MKNPNAAEDRPRRSGPFLFLAHLAVDHPFLVVLAFAILVGFTLYYIREFPIRTSYLDLLPAQDPVVEKYEAVQSELTGIDVAAVLLTLTDPPPDLDSRAQLLFSGAERVIAALDPEIFVRASYRIGGELILPPELLVFRTLYPEERQRLAEISGQILESFPELAMPSLSSPSLLSQPEELDRTLADLITAGWDFLGLVEMLPEIRPLMDEAASIVQLAQSRTLPEDEGQPLLSGDRTQLVIQIWPAHPFYFSQDFNREVRQALLEAVDEADLTTLGIRAGLTGLYVTSAEVEDIIRADMVLVTTISAVVVLVAIILVLGNLVLAVAALVPMLVATILIMGWAKFSVDGFNLLTAFIPALALGIGDDFVLLLFSRFVEARREGVPLRPALILAVRSKGAASFVAGLTTASVLGCLLLSHTRALWELGLIMMVGIGLSFLAAFLLGPALTSLAGRVFPRMRGFTILKPTALVQPYRELLFLRWGVIGVSVLLTLIMLFPAIRVEFKFSSGELAPVTDGQKVFEEIIQNFGGTLWMGDSFRLFVQSPEEIAPLTARLKEHPLVHSVVSARDLLPQELLGQASQLGGLPIGEAQAGLGQVRQLLENWEAIPVSLEGVVGQMSQLELGAILTGEVRRAQILSRRADELVELSTALSEVNVSRSLEALASVEEDLGVLQRFVATLESLPPEGELVDRILDLLPAELISQYRISKGYIVEARVSPAIYEGQNLQDFLEWLQGLGGDYVGSPELQARLESLMKRDFFQATGLAVGLIFLVLILDFRRPAKALLAMTPLAMGYVWMLAGMHLLKIPFNFTNIVISPLLVGYGADGAVHFLHRLEEERKVGGEALPRAAAATFGPTLASFTTTMAAFSALLPARTPGLRFLGISAVLGLGFTLLWTLVFLPAATGRLRGKSGQTKVS